MRRLRVVLSAMLIVAIAVLLGVGLAGAATDYDGDGYAAGDCAPLDPAVHPGAADRPDAAAEDTNCDGIDGDAAKALFVSVQAPGDAGTGTMDNPLRTIGAAIEKAKGTGKDVYVSGGTFAERVVLRTGVGVYGG